MARLGRPGDLYEAGHRLPARAVILSGSSRSVTATAFARTV